jgi:hypothetical protein
MDYDRIREKIMLTHPIKLFRNKKVGGELVMLISALNINLSFKRAV